MDSDSIWALYIIVLAVNKAGFYQEKVMTVRRSYQCDLCRSVIYEGSEDSENIINNGVGIKWGRKHLNGIEKVIIEQTYLKCSEHHLCMDCIDAIKELKFK